MKSFFFFVGKNKELKQNKNKGTKQPPFLATIFYCKDAKTIIICNLTIVRTTSTRHTKYSLEEALTKLPVTSTENFRQHTFL